MRVCVCVCHTTHVILQDGDSALMLAAEEGKTEAVMELVKAGANVDMQNEVCITSFLIGIRTRYKV